MPATLFHFIIIPPRPTPYVFLLSTTNRLPRRTTTKRRQGTTQDMSLAQLSRLLPLPQEELKQVLDYATTLSKTEAAEHFNNLLGDSPQAVEFISSFNSRRQDTKPATAPTPAPTSSSSSAPPAPALKASRGPKKKKQSNLHTPAARQLDAAPPPGTSYNKKDQQEEYYGGKKPNQPAESSGGASSSNFKQSLKSATPPPPPPPQQQQQQQQQQRTAAGYLISDKVKPKSNPVSRSSTPKPTAKPTKVSIAGGTPMAGASTALNDLDAAIRSLELTTNPTMGDDPRARRCNCVATRHPLQTAAPNCQSCGKVICVKEGLGPCTFCGTPLLSSDDVQGMIRELKAERGRERMAADREAHKRAEVSKKPAPFSQNKMSLSEAEAKAREHRDKLLSFQAQNAKRTTVRDEAADFDVSGAMAGSGGNMWSTPEDRARELKRQQKILREMEWNARPEYEKRRQVVSIDVVGGKVVRKMAAVERPTTPPDDEDVTVHEDSKENEYVGSRQQSGGGAFSRNPLLGGLIKPVWDAKGKGAQLEGRKDRRAQWRRVQDDLEDNEAVILDGGARGHSTTTADEPECG